MATDVSVNLREGEEVTLGAREACGMGGLVPPVEIGWDEFSAVKTCVSELKGSFLEHRVVTSLFPTGCLFECLPSER